MDSSNCCYCGRNIIIGSIYYTKEHLLPKSRKGNSSQANIRPCCISCNQMRQNMTFEKFYKTVEEKLKNLEFGESYCENSFIEIMKNCLLHKEYVEQNIEILTIKNRKIKMEKQEESKSKNVEKAFEILQILEGMNYLDAGDAINIAKSKLGHRSFVKAYDESALNK